MYSDAFKNFRCGKSSINALQLNVIRLRRNEAAIKYKCRFQKIAWLFFKTAFLYFYIMKTIGIIGGLTWLSTVDYYKLLNQMVNEKLGGVSSAKIILYSVEFAEIKKLTQAGDWDGIAAIMCNAAQTLEKADACISSAILCIVFAPINKHSAPAFSSVCAALHIMAAMPSQSPA